MAMSVSLSKLFVCVLFLGLLLIVPMVAAEEAVSLPERSLGDEWSFVVDYKDDVGLICNMTTTITSTSITNPSGGYSCYEFTSTAEGIVYGEGVSGTWSMTLKEYYSKSASQLVEASLTRVVTIFRSNGSSTTTTNINSVYQPPSGFNDGFPLTVGKTWTTASTITSTVRTNVDGAISEENDSYSTSMNLVVDRIENVATSTGTFKTYFLIATGADGSIVEVYYAPEVAMQIKEVDYDPMGTVTFTMDLKTYDIAQSSDSSASNPISIYWITSAVIVVVAVVSAIVIIVLKARKHKQTQ